jgi:hypothetical protein
MNSPQGIRSWKCFRTPPRLAIGLFKFDGEVPSDLRSAPKRKAQLIAALSSRRRGLAYPVSLARLAPADARSHRGLLVTPFWSYSTLRTTTRTGLIIAAPS